MKKLTTILLILLFHLSSTVPILLISVPSSYAAREVAAQRECSTCHIMWLAEFRQKEIEPLIELKAQPVVIAGRQGVVSTERMCFTCHDGFILDSRFAWKEKKRNFHPIGVKPKRVQIPKRKDGTELFPLDKNGRIYCGTCHSAHGVAWDRKDSPIFLRESNKDSMMCMICHIDRATGPVEGNHPINKTTIEIPKRIHQAGGKTGAIRNQVICQSCHRVHGADEKKLLLVKNDRSQLCGICHSDRYASNLEDARRMHTHPVNIVSEKVEISKTVTRKGGKRGGNGEIICQSCHRPHYATPGSNILVMDNHDSNLCKECHSDKKSVLITKHNMQKTAPTSVNVRGQTPVQGGPCSACHVPHRGKDARMWARSVSGKEDTISNLCKSCHSEGMPGKKKVIGDHSHPVNANIDKVGGETTLPLFAEDGTIRPKEEGGRVVCATCHNVHQWNWRNPKIASTKEGDATNSFLRKAAAPSPDLCGDCHRDKKYIVKTDHDMRVTAPGTGNIKGEKVIQTGVCGACHMIHNAPTKPKLWARKLSGKGDIIAQLCTSCHTRGGPAEKKQPGLHTHPTGKPVSNLKITISDDGKWDHPYFKGIAPRERVDLKPLPFFDSEGNRVVRGNVSCGSCHDPHRWNPKQAREGRGRNVEGDGTNSFLRMSNDPDSTLCKNCHVEKRSVAFSKHNLKITSPGDKNILKRTARKTGICSSCHLPHNGTGPKMWAREPYRRGDYVERLCKSCHRKGGPAEKKLIGKHSHPVGKAVGNLGIKPVTLDRWEIEDERYQETLKEDPLFTLPLYNRYGEKVVDGNVSCGSCHDPHQWDPISYPKEALTKKGDLSDRIKKYFSSLIKKIRKEEGDGTNSFLRITNAPESRLCKNCHVDKRAVEVSKHNLNLIADKEKNIQGLTPSQSGSCSACHLPHNGGGAKMWARPITGKEDTISNLCKSCHSRDLVAHKKIIGDYSHPVYADIDRVGGKTDLPLYNKRGEKASKEEGGRVVCATCHNPHQWLPTHYMGRIGFPEDVKEKAIDLRIVEKIRIKDIEGNAMSSFLRRAAFPVPELCINCHKDKKFVEFTDHDMSITAPEAKNISGKTVSETGKCGFCHMVHNTPNRFRLWAVKPGPGDDGMEKLCRSCHLKGGIAGNKLPRYFNHPPDVKVTSRKVRTGKDKKVQYLPVFKISGEPAKAGVITCPTCHNPHQWSALNPGYGPGKNTEGNNTNSFLRGRSEYAICSDCHGFDALFRYKYYHGESSRKKGVPLRGFGP